MRTECNHLLLPALVAAVTLQQVAFAQCTKYTLSPIGLSCTGFIRPRAVSELGNVVGYFACGFAEDRAFISWNGGSPSGLEFANQVWSRAYGINSLEHIAGTVDIVGLGTRPFLYQDGKGITLPVLPNHDTGEGLDLNDSDVIVGYSANTQVGPVVACRWVNGVIEMLNLPQGPGANANGVNHVGQIVGYMGFLPSGGLAAEAFLWENGNVTPLGKPDDATNSNANAISDNGIIVGHFTTADPQGEGGYKPRALAWINGEMIDLGVLPGYLYSRAFDVNDTGYIVGYCNNPPSLGQGVKGFIWFNGQMMAVADLLAPQYSQYQVRLIYGISADGRIAAVVRQPGGGDIGARLDPVPSRLGDTNCDWLVNVTDLLAVINAWGPAPPQIPFEGSPDLNGDATVNVLDLLAIINDWG